MDIDAAVAAKQSNVVAITLAAQPFICRPPSHLPFSAHLCSLQTYKQPQWQPPVLLLLHLTAPAGAMREERGLCVCVWIVRTCCQVLTSI